jgi:3-oxoacyl-(acyl-carrier-protein) synthase
MRLASPMLFPHSYANATNSLICIQFHIRGYNQNLCGDWLCGAGSLLVGMEALWQGRADMMLAGGCDTPTEFVVRMLARERAGAAARPLCEAACLLTLETGASADERGVDPICELAAITSAPTGLCSRPRTDAEHERMAAAVSNAVAWSLSEAGLWEGDVGVVLRAGPQAADDGSARALDAALAGFSQVPALSIGARFGQGLAADFPLECAAAALMVSEGVVPAKASLERVKDGIELWREEEAPAMLGDAALVIGCTPHSAVSAVLLPV